MNIGAHCKYGDRCTFAHGDHDMRAKFVKAELLYSPAAQPQSADPSQMQAMGANSEYGTVDYSAFSQPPSLEQVAPPVPVQTTVVPEPATESQAKEAADYGSDFQIPVFQDHFQEEDDNQFFNSFNYNNGDLNSNGHSSAMTSSTPKEMFSEQKDQREVSKFDFVKDAPESPSHGAAGLVDQMKSLKISQDSLVERIEELELTTDKQEAIEKFSQAKYQIEMGNVEKGNEILGEMFASKQIKYKEFSNIDQHIMNTFGPISD